MKLKEKCKCGKEPMWKTHQGYMLGGRKYCQKCREKILKAVKQTIYET